MVPAAGRGGRGATQGAFGRGGKPARSRKSKRAKRQEWEQQQAPAPGGVSLPRGNGATIRMRRGASLSDFADRIDVNPASLITVLFAMGEMATATQSLDEDTFELLGNELGYKIEIVSPEDEERELLEQFDIDLDAELAEEDEDVADYVRALEETRDTADLPEASGEAIAREFERYLKRRDTD